MGPFHVRPQSPSHPDVDVYVNGQDGDRVDIGLFNPGGTQACSIFHEGRGVIMVKSLKPSIPRAGLVAVSFWCHWKIVSFFFAKA